jgi:hypothetical protein
MNSYKDAIKDKAEELAIQFANNCIESRVSNFHDLGVFVNEEMDINLVLESFFGEHYRIIAEQFDSKVNDSFFAFEEKFGSYLQADIINSFFESLDKELNGKLDQFNEMRENAIETIQEIKSGEAEKDLFGKYLNPDTYRRAKKYAEDRGKAIDAIKKEIKYKLNVRKTPTSK